MSKQIHSFRISNERLKRLHKKLDVENQTQVVNIALSHLEATLDAGESIKHEVMNYEQI